MIRRSRAGAVRALYDRRRGLDTDGHVLLDELGLAAENRIEYRPSSWTALRRILPAREVSADDVFIDFGSGKGRVVVQAAQYPFRRVIGVELATPLHDIALANVRRVRSGLRCRNIDLVNEDVLTYAIPDDVSVAFFYNPFTGGIFADVVRRLIASHDRRPRRLRIVYVNPEEESLLLATGRVRLVRSWAGRNSGAGSRLYEVTPAS